MPETTMTVTASFLPRLYRCPTCDAICKSGGFIVTPDLESRHFGTVESTVPGLEGKYCMRCYAEWLSRTFARLVPLDDAPPTLEAPDA